MLRDLELVSAQQAAHGRLRDLILSGELVAGQALRQEDLARQLGVSRLPVREALSRLATEGLVELKPRRGFYVASLSIEEIQDIFEMRAMLEERAGGLATESMTSANADALDGLVAELDLAIEAGENFDRYARLNLEFHERLYQTSGRKHLQHQIILLRNSVASLIRLLAHDPGEMQRAQREHRMIAQAYRRRNKTRVANLCREHCAYTERALIKKIRASGADRS